MRSNREGLWVGGAVLGWALIVLGIVVLMRQQPTYVMRRAHDTVYVKMSPETVYVQAKLPRSGGRVKVAARGGRSARDSATVEVLPVGDSLLVDVALHLAHRDTLLPVALDVPVQVQADSRCSGGLLHGFILGVGVVGVLLALAVVL